MPIAKLPFSGGAFQSVDEFELLNSPNSPVYKNFLLNDAGSNITRPGLELFADVTKSAIGMTFFSGQIVVVTSDRRIKTLDLDGTVTDVTGVTLGGNERPIFANDGTFLAIAGGGVPIKWSGSGTTELLPGSPPEMTHIVFVDGFWFGIEDVTTRYRWAGPLVGDRETWDPLDFASAEGSPDNITAIIKSIREIYLFGPESVQIVFNMGDVDVPFQSIFFIDRGTIAPYSVVLASDVVFFLDQARRFVSVENRKPIIISSPFDRTIQKFTKVDDCFASLIEIERQYLIVWTFPTERRTFWYNYINQQWGEFTEFGDGVETRFRANSHIYVSSVNKHYIGDFRNGNIYELSFSFKDDAGDPIRRIRRSGPIDHGASTRKRSNEYRFSLKRGEGASGGTEPVMEVKWRDNFGAFTSPKQVGLGLTGDRNQIVTLLRNGIYKQRQIEITVTDPIDFTLHQIEENFDVMTK